MRLSRIAIYLGTATVIFPMLTCGEAETGHDVNDIPLQELEVRIESAKLVEVASSFEAVGTVRSEVTTVLSSRIMGQVTAVEVDEGDRIRLGQLLAKIDNREAQAQFEKAEAGLSEAESAGEELDRAIGASQSGLDAARANAKLAQSTHQRFEQLLTRNSVSQQEFDEIDAEYTAAQAEVRRAEEMLRSVEAKKEQVKARVNQAQANLASTRLYQGYTRITSPLNGIVTTRSVEIGQLASPGTPLFTVEDGRHYRLDANVEASRMRFVSLTQKLEVRVDALDEGFEGVVTEIVPVSHPASRSFSVKIDLPEHPQLRSGLFGRVRIPGKTRRSLTIPQSSIITRGQLSGVFVIGTNSKARFQLVKTGKESGERVEVLSGLEEGDQVVIEPVEQVQDGQPLRVVDSSALLLLNQREVPAVGGSA